MDPSELRPIAIALAASAALPHPAACRLAVEAARWARRDRLPAPGPELGVPSAALAAALELAADAERIAAEVELRAARHGARIVTLGEPAYPSAFGALDLPPPALWIAGEIPERPALAIVGARKASRYGLEAAAWLGRGAAEAGALVVSGFAIGVDAAAHDGALAADDGATVAVLGCGLDIDYPRGHRELGRRIRSAGALVSEFPIGHEPRPWQFPVRNRLIAALARAVVVVEAAPKSGSLVTARLALDLGRELLAVPGRVTDELAVGPNLLIADGATPALSAADLAHAVGLEVRAVTPLERDAPRGLAGDALALWRAAVDDAALPETLAARTGLSIERALARLLELEIAGHLRRAPDGRYAPPG